MGRGILQRRSRMAAVALLLLCCCTGMLGRTAVAQSNTYSNFNNLYEVQWSGDHIVALDSGMQVELEMDQYSGAGFQSISSYTYGFFSVAMKLVPGNSAGTVTAFFLSSAGDAHDEVDFEFLGNLSGQPYILQTNMFASGVGGREQRTYLWFDPTADFHTYGVIWNHAQILFLIDNQPIRVFKNLQSMGEAYPSTQQTQAFASLFDGSSWATQSGTVPIDYSAAPFIVTYGEFQIDACVNDGTSTPSCKTNYLNNWWESSEYTSLSSSQITYLENIRKNYLVYDYCLDRARYPTTPVECSYNYNT